MSARRARRPGKDHADLRPGISSIGKASRGPCLAVAGHHQTRIARPEAKNRSLRIVMLLAWLPALALVVFVSLWGFVEQGSQDVLAMVRPLLPLDLVSDPHAYRAAIWTVAYSMFFKFEIFFIMLLTMLAGPNLISRDLRFGAFAAVFLPAAHAAGLYRGQARCHCCAGGCRGRCARDCRLYPRRLLQPGHWHDPRHMARAAGKHNLRLGDRCLGRDVNAGPFVAIAAVALRRHRLGRRVDHQRGRGGRLGRHPGRLHPTHALAAKASEGPVPNLRQIGTLTSSRRTEAGTARVDSKLEHDERTIEGRWPKQRRPTGVRSAPTPLISTRGGCPAHTNAAWVQIGRAVEGPQAALQPFLGGRKSSPRNERRLADRIVPQYPWFWSAGVLAALFGLSLWTLRTRVKSLDRLR